MQSRFLLPDGEVSDGVRAILPDQDFCLFSEALAEEDLSAVEFYVPPYPGGPAVIDMLPHLSGLKVVQLLTAGVDWILPRIPPGVLLYRAIGVHESSVAEQVIGGILAVTKEIPAFVRFQANAEWAHRRVGGLLGMRAVVLGYGAIGKATGDLLGAFGVEVKGISRSGRHATLPLSAISGLLPNCDILVITLPLTDETKGLVDAKMLSLLPDGALVVNVSRGSIVESAALEEELVSGRLRAALDVTEPEPLPRESPLWHLPNVLITPHVGGDSDLFPRLASQMVVAQMTRYIDGLPLAHQVVGKY
jgi:Phosphoglycerate dehydrogenase and related dehydrogenases